MSRYQEGGYHAIQEFARTGSVEGSGMTKSEAREMQRRLDRVTSSQSVTDSVLYRGVGYEYTNRVRVGATIPERGYASTSTNRNVAREYAQKYGEHGALLEIRVPRGTRGYRLSDAGLGEAEVLLGRRSGFRVNSVRYENGVRVVSVDLVNPRRR